ncbi:TonB-dependent receptor domain-containing protein [Novosphingobium terrae]|uniref:TonB-dependent receptor domain-containing protein n=1 Tax=Novosphingobium terrae TaxID=2726189 RepID=UPI00197D4A89|nr:TonB-dependent receptor [Novosphingobium terrae]
MHNASRRAMLCALAPALLIVAPAHATPPASPISIDLPAQPLAHALDSLAHQSGWEILYPYATAAARRSAAIHGHMPVASALRHLLKGSGLEIASITPGTIILRAAPPPRAQALVRPARPGPPPPPAAAPPSGDILVTGRAAQGALAQTELSYAVSRIDADTLHRNGPLTSTADLFRQIPGFWVEATGGEASNNIRARGIPTDGYSSVAMLEDGLPIQYDGGLAYLNTDQIMRVDSTIERVEAVRGGPSAIFQPNAPGGSINFLTRSGLKDPGLTVSTTLGSAAYRRIDGYWGMRITPELGLSLGGFYRQDNGLRNPGYPADQGGQIRAGLDYDDGGLQLSLNGKWLDDRVILYLPVPLQSNGQGRVQAVPGFDPLYDTLAGPQQVHVAFKTANGPQDFDLSQGTHSRIGFLTLRARRTLGAPGALEIKTRLRSGTTLRNGLFPVGQPMTGSSYLASVWPQLSSAFPSATSAAIRYTGSDQPFLSDSNGNGLVVGANLLSVRMPMTEWITDARLTQRLDAAGHHDLALGLTFADTRLGFARTMSTALLDVRGQARRLDVVALDGAGRQVGALTDNGFTRYGSIFDNAQLHTSNLALYLADEWKLGRRWRIDLGGRWEQTRIGGSMENSTAVNLGDAATLADDAVLTGTGQFTPIHRRFSGLNATVGVNYRPVSSLGFFLRYTRINRLPSASEFTSTPNRTDEADVPITMAEAGVIAEHRRWNLSAVGFSTHFARLPFTDYRFDTASNAYVETTSIADTTTIGLELSGHADLLGPLSLDLQATVQDPRYRNFHYVTLMGGQPVAQDATGNQLIRVPALALRAAPSLKLMGGRLRLGAELVHYSARYADIANSQRLPPYGLLNATLNAKLTHHATLVLSATNITNALGVTEGNPRAGSFNAGGLTSFFLARPEFGRALRMTLSVTR